jgi:hypothetical protein
MSDFQLFDIFVGGPMIAPTDPARDTLLDSAGGRMFDHMPNLRSVVQELVDDLNEELKGKLRLRVFGPPSGGAGDISSEVFARIDECDLGIFDCSGPAHETKDGDVLRERASPNVIYEVGLMHALGRPTIIVDIPGLSVFYLSQCYHCLTQDFQTETLREVLRASLREVIRSALSPQTFFFSDGLGDDDPAEDPLQNPELNPLTKHYSMPLIELASSTGLATGYFRNMLLDIFKGRFALEIAPKRSDDSINPRAGEGYRFSHLVILVPDDLEGVEVLRHDLLDMLKEPQIAALGLRHEKIVLPASEKDKRTRDKTFASIGPYLYDIPTTLIATTLSPPYRLVSQLKASRTSELSRSRIQRREGAILRVFFNTVKRLAADSPDCERPYEVIKPLNVAEFRARLLAGGDAMAEPTQY